MPTEPNETSVDLSRKLVYLAAERTLSAWIRTALSLMALGFVIDRFGLIVHRMPSEPGHNPLHPRMLSTWGGSILVAMGALMALTAGIRYLNFARGYHRERATRTGHSIYMGSLFALLLALFGIILIIVLTTILP
jgi:putative membrane protein